MDPGGRGRTGSDKESRVARAVREAVDHERETRAPVRFLRLSEKRLRRDTRF